MPRTRQSAKRSTGGFAPHFNINSSAIKKSKKASIARKTARSLTSSSTDTKPQNIITFITQPDVPTHVLTVQVQGPVNEKADMDKDHDEVACLVLFYDTYDSLFKFIYSGAPLAKMVATAFAVIFACGLSVLGV
jgi:hypothetical protein